MLGKNPFGVREASARNESNTKRKQMKSFKSSCAREKKCREIARPLDHRRQVDFDVPRESAVVKNGGVVLSSGFVYRLIDFVRLDRQSIRYRQ